jgi:hypothetical protein
LNRWPVRSFAAAATNCPSNAHDFQRRTWDAAPGAVEETYLKLAPGVSCISVWAVDTFGRPSAKPATLLVKVVAS